jgi:hypothetical protein
MTMINNEYENQKKINGPHEINSRKELPALTQRKLIHGKNHRLHTAYAKRFISAG